MAYWYDDLSARSVGTSRRVVDLICDTDADIQDLPTSVAEGVPQPDSSTVHLPVEQGSSCMVIGSSSLYMLNSQDQWVEM